ncbi:oxidoreductase [Metarhizium album ARSEF 1941]|uniref:Hydroxynaphthalene reductase-like protein Arp2 n=1 Tax=Metarhizium album (strain ARSEF 1941) TaxID=1081103 RepID=A0A0B2WX97_METAS|nr:oxidoreductase [Metarhizium album ARSEF 1941]KHN97495.1 oxidoreductase [Metarhizium album ARSEF 1941]
MESFAAKIIAITGGASGIGAATCRLLAKRGAAVICVGDACSTNFDSLHEAVAGVNPATLLQCTVLDVTSSDQVDQWLRDIVSAHGDLHGAANIAGVAQGAGLRATPTILGETDADWSRVLKVNLDCVFYCTRAQVGAMKDLPGGARRSIVNVASIAAFSHVPDVYAYSTSKQACAHFTACVAADVVRIGIRVNCVSPGITNTPLLPQFEPNAKSLDEIRDLYARQGLSMCGADEVARTIVWLLSQDSHPVYGANINVGAGVP